jgi:hypothetical protein
MLGVASEGRARGLKEPRDLSLVEIFADDNAGGCSEAGKDKGNLILLNKLARLFESLRGRVTIATLMRLILRPLMPPWSLIIAR